MQQVDNKKENALLKINTVTMAAKSSLCNIKSLKSHSPDSAQTNSFIQDQKVLFLIEFSAGALGGVVSRTALVLLLVLV